MTTADQSTRQAARPVRVHLNRTLADLNKLSEAFQVLPRAACMWPEAVGERPATALNFV